MPSSGGASSRGGRPRATGAARVSAAAVRAAALAAGRSIASASAPTTTTAPTERTATSTGTKAGSRTTTICSLGERGSEGQPCRPHRPRADPIAVCALADRPSPRSSGFRPPRVDGASPPFGGFLPRAPIDSRRVRQLLAQAIPSYGGSRLAELAPDPFPAVVLAASVAAGAISAVAGLGVGRLLTPAGATRPDPQAAGGAVAVTS